MLSSTLQNQICRMGLRVSVPSYGLFSAGRLFCWMLLVLSVPIRAIELLCSSFYFFLERPRLPNGSFLAHSFLLGRSCLAYALEKVCAPYLIESFRRTLPTYRKLLRRVVHRIDRIFAESRNNAGASKATRYILGVFSPTFLLIRHALGLLSSELASTCLLLLTGIHNFWSRLSLRGIEPRQQSLRHSRTCIATTHVRSGSFRPFSWRPICRFFGLLCLYIRSPLADYNRHASDVQTLIEAWPRQDTTNREAKKK